jgi:hypothetical protein
MRPRSRSLRLFVLACAGLVGGVLVAEASLLLVRYWKRGSLRSETSYDAELGWVPTPNYAPRDQTLRDFNGTTHRRRYRTNELGSRLWGTHPSRRKIVFIGDSVTEAIDVSDDETYYARFAAESGLDTYAIGGKGYGTLQENKLLERTLRRSGMTPEILALQFCASNDFSNNSAVLEAHSLGFHESVRPYRDPQGGVFYTLGRNRLFVTALRYSAVFRTGLQVANKALALVGEARHRLSPETKQAALRQAADITGRLLIEMKSALHSSTDAYAFNPCGRAAADGFDQEGEFIRLATTAGFTPLPGAAAFIVAGPGGHTAVLAGDGSHLNVEGNRRLAEFLVKAICALEACPGVPDAPRRTAP